MKGNNFITIASVIVAAASISYAAGRSAQGAVAAAQPVQVTNTTSQAVPTSIYHSIALPAVQSGAWNVGDEGDKAPFERFATVYMTLNGSSATDQFTVPAGKRYIIDSVSMESESTGLGNDYALRALVAVNSGSGYRASLMFPMQSGAFPGYTWANLPCHLIAEPGDVVRITLLRTTSPATTPASFYTLSGHWVTVP